MAGIDAKKSFHALRNIYLAAKKIRASGKGTTPKLGEYGFEWLEPSSISDIKKNEPINWSFEISCRIKGQSLWDGHLEEYHLHDVIGAQYKNSDMGEEYRWIQWETRIPKNKHEYYIDEMLAWASGIVRNS